MHFIKNAQFGVFFSDKSLLALAWEHPGGLDWRLENPGEFWLGFISSQGLQDPTQGGGHRTDVRRM